MEFLFWLAGPGASYLAGYAISMLAENWPKWHTLPKWVKVFTPVVFSVLVALLGTYLIQHAEIIANDPYMQALLSMLTTYIGSQQAYMKTKQVGYGANPRA